MTVLRECDIENVTQPDSIGNVALARPPADVYVPTESLPRTKRLVFPGPRMQLRTQIQTPERRYSLRGIFVINVSYLDNGDVCASHATLPVDGIGSDAQSALSAFCDAFDFQWRHLVDVGEDQLTQGGLKRRRAMQDAVEGVLEFRSR